MKRRSFFQRVIGGFAAAVGVPLLKPETLWQRIARQYRQGHLGHVVGYDWYIDQMVPTIRVTEPPNVAMVFIASGGRGYTLPYSPELDAAIAARDALTIGPTIYKQL